MQAEIITIQAGDLLIGLRTNDPRFTRRLEHLLQEHVITGVVAPPNLSVALGDRDGARRAMSLLYRSATRELRTGSVGRLLRAVPRQIEGYLRPPVGTTRLNARALVGRDDAVLVDRRFDTDLERVEPRLAAKGYRRSDFPFADIDTATGELRIGLPRVQFEPAAAAELDAEYPLDRRELDAAERRVPVRRLLTAVPSLKWETLDTPAERVMALAPLTANRHRHVSHTGIAVLADWLVDDRLDLRSFVNDEVLLGLVDQGRR